MITRIFRATVLEELQDEFEEKFIAFSVPLVKSQKGMVSVSVARPTKWNPNDFIMISVWKDEASLKAFAGERWNEAVIPEQMKKFFLSYSLEHYVNIDC